MHPTRSSLDALFARSRGRPLDVLHRLDVRARRSLRDHWPYLTETVDRSTTESATFTRARSPGQAVLTSTRNRAQSDWMITRSRGRCERCHAERGHPSAGWVAARQRLVVRRVVAIVQPLHPDARRNTLTPCRNGPRRSPLKCVWRSELPRRALSPIQIVNSHLARWRSSKRSQSRTDASSDRGVSSTASGR